MREAPKQKAKGESKRNILETWTSKYGRVLKSRGR